VTFSRAQHYALRGDVAVMRLGDLYVTVERLSNSNTQVTVGGSLPT
jgi:hypothetical protein